MSEASVDISPWLGALARIEPQMVTAAADGLKDAGLQILGNAQELTPVDTGALKGSATWLGPTIDGTKVEFVIGFNTDYAIFVHEILTSFHEPPTRAKFLETPLRDAVATGMVQKAIDFRVKQIKGPAKQ